MHQLGRNFQGGSGGNSTPKVHTPYDSHEIHWNLAGDIWGEKRFYKMLRFDVKKMVVLCLLACFLTAKTTIISWDLRGVEIPC